MSCHRFCIAVLYISRVCVPMPNAITLPLFRETESDISRFGCFILRSPVFAYRSFSLFSRVFLARAGFLSPSSPSRLTLDWHCSWAVILRFSLAFFPHCVLYLSLFSPFFRVLPPPPLPPRFGGLLTSPVFSYDFRFHSERDFSMIYMIWCSLNV